MPVTDIELLSAHAERKLALAIESENSVARSVLLGNKPAAERCAAIAKKARDEHTAAVMAIGLIKTLRRDGSEAQK